MLERRSTRALVVVGFVLCGLTQVGAAPVGATPAGVPAPQQQEPPWDAILSALRAGDPDALAADVNESIKRLSSDIAEYDGFGEAIAISGDTVVVGASFDDDGGSSSGSAYVLDRDEGGANNWGEVAKLAASDAASNDYFGRSVSVSGDTAIVGAYGNTDTGTFSGSAYVFDRDQGGADNWGQVKKLVPGDPAMAHYFGHAVAVSGDTVVVGAWGDGHAGIKSGAAYVFARDQGGADNWGQVTKLIASDAAARDNFGNAVAISADTIAVGSYSDDHTADNAGSAYIFGRNEGGAGNWGEVAKMVAGDAAEDDEFGGCLAISGDTVVVCAWSDNVAAGSAYIYDRDQGGADNWGQVKKLTAADPTADDFFGRSASISGDTVVVGVSNDDDGGTNSGSAYVFGRAQGGAGNWGQVKKLTASDATAGDKFGKSVGISGTTIVVGADEDNDGGTNAGSVYVFAGFPRSATPTAPSGTITDRTPTYSWDAVAADAADANADAATWYYLWVDGPSGNVVKQWYTATSAGCDGGGTCSVTPSTTLEAGAHTWWVRTWNSSGQGPWSSEMDFTVAATAPGAAVPSTPTGTIAEFTPTYTWPAVLADGLPGDEGISGDAATWYYLWVDGPSGNVVKQWYTATAAGCAGGGTCSVTPSAWLDSGPHSWWVRTWNSADAGPWSARVDFTVDGSYLGAAPLISPAGAITDSTPTYTWTAVTNATWYYLWVDGPSGNVIKQWYTAWDAGCGNGGTCSVTPTTPLAAGAHSWWIRTWGDSGNGPWSARQDFTYSAPGTP